MQLFIELGQLDRYTVESAAQKAPHLGKFQRRVKEARLEVSRIGLAIVTHQAEHGCG